MKIYNNLFGCDNVFYINIKNEVYQMKFRHVVLPMVDNVFDENDELDFDRKDIRSIEIEVASLGVFKWYHRMYEPSFSPTDIYKNVEDCINKRNPIFIWSCGELRFNPCWCSFFFAVKKDFAPKNSFLVLGYNLYGKEVYKIKTYKWDGLNPKEVFVTTPNHFNDLVNDPYEHVCFDLSTEEWLISEDEKMYGSYDDCVSDNYIKVHTF
jgi:hypothetical protein